MALKEAAETAAGLRSVIQDLIMPDLKTVQVEVRHLAQQVQELRTDMLRQFTELRAQVDVYRDVQALKEQMAELRGLRPERGPSA